MSIKSNKNKLLLKIVDEDFEKKTHLFDA